MMDGWKALALWASQTPRPQPPELVPGLDAINEARRQQYRADLVAWIVGKTEALMHGLE